MLKRRPEKEYLPIKIYKCARCSCHAFNSEVIGFQVFGYNKDRTAIVPKWVCRRCYELIQQDDVLENKQMEFSLCRELVDHARCNDHTTTS